MEYPSFETGENGLALISKTDLDIVSSGIHCRQSQATLSSADMETFELRIRSIISSHMQATITKFGYILFPKNQNDFLFYLNHGPWIIFISLVATDVMSHFRQFHYIIRHLVTTLDQDSSNSQEIITQLTNKFSKSQDLPSCLNCPSRNRCSIGILPKFLDQFK